MAFRTDLTTYFGRSNVVPAANSANQSTGDDCHENRFFFSLATTPTPCERGDCFASRHAADRTLRGRPIHHSSLLSAGLYVPFNVFEAVNPDGSSSFSFPTDGSLITVMGIVLNNPSNMLDSTPDYNTSIGNLGGQWQVFIQAYSDPVVGGSPTDFGGSEVWMGQCYGNLPFINDPGDIYTNSQWTAQLARLDSPTLLSTGNTVSLQAGDVVAITGVGLEYEGMMNINEKHQVNVTPPVFPTSTSFTITALETGMPLPAPTVTTLNQLMNSSGKFYFDPTRQTGAEHLQGTLVELDGVRLLSGTWAPNNQVVVTDGSLRQMILNLGNNPNLTTAPTGAFNVTGIEDQESTHGTNSSSYEGGYTLWVTDSGNVSAQANSGGTFNWLRQQRELECWRQLESGQQAAERGRCGHSRRIACSRRNRHLGRDTKSRRPDFRHSNTRTLRRPAIRFHPVQAVRSPWTIPGPRRFDGDERQPLDHGSLAACGQLGCQRRRWQQPDAFWRHPRE